MEERREYVRISCRLDVESKTGENWYILYSKNISVGGMMLSCESDIEKLKKSGIDIEQKVFLSFYLPDQNNVVKVSGKVIHIDRKTDPVDGSEASFIGIQFNDVSDQVKKQLESFISTNEKKPLV